jgi:hypothetical protein
MPSAADPANLNANLHTFAQLEHSPAGSKLSFNNATGRFSIQKPGPLQVLARTASRDSVTSEEYFGKPARLMFAAAYPQRNTDNGLFDHALQGLRALRGSYTGDKRAALDAVISDAQHGLGKESMGNIRLREKYQRFVVYGFSQSMFLPETNPGVCYSFTIEWARRIILSNKESFAASENGPAIPSGNTLTPQQKVRMMAKVDSRIRPLQAEFGGWDVSNFGTLLAGLSRSDNVQFQKYGNLAVFPLTNHPQPIAPDDKGSAVLGHVLTEANRYVERGLANVFLVNMKDRGKPGGHTIGIHLHQGGFHFFDPNFGEFNFPNSAGVNLLAFLNEWWSSFYRPPHDFESWKLEGVAARQYARQ